MSYLSVFNLLSTRFSTDCEVRNVDYLRYYKELVNKASVKGRRD